MRRISIIKTLHGTAWEVIKQYLPINSSIGSINNTNCSRNFSLMNSKVSHFPTGEQVTVSRTITKQDVEKFTELSGDTNLIHDTDKQKNAVVHGAFLNSLVSCVIGTKLPGPGCLVIQQTLNFPNKCYVGETVYVTVKLLENRKILKLEFICDVRDKKKTVLYGSAKIIMSK